MPDYRRGDPVKAPRWMHKLRARLGGYFWEPCPLCGNEFGGHEWHTQRWPDDPIDSIPIAGTEGKSIAICPDCVRAGRGRCHPNFTSYRCHCQTCSPHVEEEDADA